MPRRRPSPSPLLSPPVLIILLPIITILLLIYTIPLFLSFTSQIVRPTISVKKSWDSLNVFLVIFAILCGIFAKRNEDGSSTEEDHVANSISDSLSHVASTNNTATTSESELVLPQQWLGYLERINTAADSGGGRLRRSSSSYPDLRQAESLWGDHKKSQFRFFDDFEINGYNRPPPKSNQTHQSPAEEYSDVIKEIPVDTFVVHSSPPSKSVGPPPPPSPPPLHQKRKTYRIVGRKDRNTEKVVINKMVNEAEEFGKVRSPLPTPPTPPPPPPAVQKTRRTYQTVGHRDEKTEKIVGDNIINEAEEFEKVRSPPPTPPPPPPPRSTAPPSPIQIRSEHKRRKSNVKKEIAMVWASVLSNQRKKKKHKASTTRDIYENASQSSPEQPQQGHFYTRPPPSPPPPPPPPPPPYSVFHNLFKKGTSKTKKVHSVSSPPAPPPPPPQPALRKHKSWSAIFPSMPPTPPPQLPPRAARRRDSAGSGRPPLPTKTNSYLYEENVNSGCQSPLIPPPPPLPPFKLPDLRFSVRGDFVKIQSAQSSRCGSPELEDDDAMPGKEEDLESKSKSQSQCNVIGGGSGGSSVFCPSPDVNMKAANFIARLRDEWRLEKVNSMKEKNKMA